MIACLRLSVYWCPAPLSCRYVIAVKKCKSQASTRSRKEAMPIFASTNAPRVTMRCGLLFGLRLSLSWRPLPEGMSIRSVERLTRVHRDTIMRLGARVGRGCAELQDRMMVGLRVPRIECDELWAYVGCKSPRRRLGAPCRGPPAGIVVGACDGRMKRKAPASWLTGAKYCFAIPARMLRTAVLARAFSRSGGRASIAALLAVTRHEKWPAQCCRDSPVGNEKPLPATGLTGASHG